MSRPPLLRGSNLARVKVCPPSAVLPQTGRVGDAASSRGIAIHYYLQLIPLLGKAAALERIAEEHPEFLPDCEVINLSDLPPTRPDLWKPEVDIAWNWETGEVRVGEAASALPPGGPWIHGHPDTHAIIDGELFVLDWKTGHYKYGPPADLLQLRFYFCVLALFYGVERGRVGIVTIQENGEPRWHVETIGPVMLAQIGLELLDLVERALAAKPTDDVTEGPHCKFCPAFDHCSAKTALLTTITHEALAPTRDSELTPATAGVVADWLERADQVLERARSKLREYATQVGGVPMPDGRVFGPHEWTTSVVDAEKAEPVLASTFDSLLALDAVRTERLFTFEQLTDGLRQYKARAPGRTLKSLNEQARAVLKDGGALTTKTTYPCSPYTPKPPPALKPATTQERDHDAEVD